MGVGAAGRVGSGEAVDAGDGLAAAVEVEAGSGVCWAAA
jgi:hypothetical protein